MMRVQDTCVHHDKQLFDPSHHWNRISCAASVAPRSTASSRVRALNRVGTLRPSMTTDAGFGRRAATKLAETVRADTRGVRTDVDAQDGAAAVVHGAQTDRGEFEVAA